MGGRYENDSDEGRKVHQNVDVLLARKGMKTGQLIEGLGIENRASYYAFFKPVRGPSVEQLKRLASALGVMVDELVSEVSA